MRRDPTHDGDGSSIAMSISVKTRKMLWGRFGGTCAICKRKLFEDESETDNPSVVGEECHIVAREEDGPRGMSPLTLEERDFYDNLILLCLEHHKIIDDQPEKYTVGELQRLKADHLKWVAETLGSFDPVRQRDEEIYAGFIDRWAALADLDGWEGFTFGIMSGDAPALRRDRDKAFEQLHEWLFKRAYPERYPLLAVSLENFRLVLGDFHRTFSSRVEPDSPERATFVTEKFYKIREYDEDLYHRVHKEYGDHVNLLQDLTLELTRAGNYVCDRVREFLTPTFRLKEGLLIARTGTWRDGYMHMLRPAYQGAERTARPYPGLAGFMTVRLQRDLCYAKEE